MEFKELFGNYSQAGSVIYIGVRPKRLSPVKRVEHVLAVKDTGLDGDRYNAVGGNRQVTLIQSEHLETVASIMGVTEVNPSLVRKEYCGKRNQSTGLKGKDLSYRGGHTRILRRMSSVFTDGRKSGFWWI